MERFLEMGYYLGFGGGLTRPNAKKVRACARTIPQERILLETDAPYIGTHLVPKGETEPRETAAVAAILAEIRGWSVAETVSLTTANAFRLFGAVENIEVGE
jgi:TatD DNase family protein